jgi:hypothetical protein
MPSRKSSSKSSRKSVKVPIKNRRKFRATSGPIHNIAVYHNSPRGAAAIVTRMFASKTGKKTFSTGITMTDATTGKVFMYKVVRRKLKKPKVVKSLNFTVYYETDITAVRQKKSTKKPKKKKASSKKKKSNSKKKTTIKKKKKKVSKTKRKTLSFKASRKKKSSVSTNLFRSW